MTRCHIGSTLNFSTNQNGDVWIVPSWVLHSNSQNRKCSSFIYIQKVSPLNIGRVFSAFINKNTQKSISYLYFLSRTWKRYQICTHTQHTLINDSFGVVKFCSLKGEGRRGWEGMVKNGVRKKHMIILELIEFIFFMTYNILDVVGA